MTRDDLVTEVIGLLRCGVFQHHEVFDPTVLTRPRLQEQVKHLRLRMLAERRLGAPALTSSAAPSAPTEG
jgi:hypothetical protein